MKNKTKTHYCIKKQNFNPTLVSAVCNVNRKCDLMMFSDLIISQNRIRKSRHSDCNDKRLSDLQVAFLLKSFDGVVISV